MIAVIATVYAPFVAARLTDDGAYWFVHVGRTTLEAAHSSTILTPALGWQSPVGYDGQYYFALAVDPRHAKDYMPTGVAGFVYSRPVYPAVSGLLGLGSTSAVPWTMLLLNLIAVAAGTYAVAAWLRRRRVSAWFALLYGLFPGLFFCVFRDLTEPLAFGLVALAGLALDRASRRAVPAGAVLLAVAALTRETTLVFALVAALAVARSGATTLARGARAILFMAVCTAPLLIWRLVVGAFVPGPTQERGDGLLSLVPFHGLGHYYPWDAEHWLIAGAVALPTIVTLLVAAYEHRPTLRLPHLLLGLNAAAFVVFLPAGVDVDYGAAGRAATGVVLATIVCLGSWRPARLSPRVAAVVLVWSLAWYVVYAAAVGLPAFGLVTS